MTASCDQVRDLADADAERLGLQLARIRVRLLAACGRADPADVSAADATAAAAGDAAERPAALDLLRLVFALTPFEVDLVLLAAAYELDPNIGDLCADAGDPRRPYPTFALALAVLPDPHWSALAPGGPLRTWRLLTPSNGPLTAAQLLVDERVLHYLLGIDQVDHRLQPYVVPVVAHHQLPPSHDALSLDVLAGWSGVDAHGVPVRIVGRDELDRRAVAAAAAARNGRSLWLVRAADLPQRIDDRDEFVRLWQREQALTGRPLLVELADDGDEQLADWLLPRLSGPVAVSARERATGAGPVRVIEVDLPTTAERTALLTGRLTDPEPAEVTRVAAHFELPAAALGTVSAEADGAVTGLWAAARRQARPQLAGLAQRVEVRAGWDDLVLPELQVAALHDIVVHVRHRSTVHDDWGFAERSSRGYGVSVLFAGPSGTGKTLAAEVLAHELDLDLYVVDLSSVVSKYIGETEKNLRRLFDAAEGGGAVLLFDEADALFGKRSEVRDSHDRYANIEVSYLLQRMERYRGVAILTTNQRAVLDEAFLRRLRFVVAFPFPDSQQRAAIWRRAFPAAVPRAALLVDELARLSITGGSIANIALSAAYSAAARGDSVQRHDLLRAAQQEYAKLERTLTDVEAGGMR